MARNEPELEYGVLCPECLKAGKEYGIGLYTEIDAITCAKPKSYHYFTREQVDELIAMRDVKPPVEETAAAEVPVEETTKPVEVEKKPAGYVQVSDAETQPDGDMTVIVTIPEWIAVALKSESENRLLTFEEAAAEIIELTLSQFFGLATPVR